MEYSRKVSKDELQPGDQFLLEGIRVCLNWISDTPDHEGLYQMDITIVGKPDVKLGLHSVRPDETFELLVPIEIRHNTLKNTDRSRSTWL